MITPFPLPTARPGLPGLTFFVCRDVSVATYRDTWRLKVLDQEAASRLRSLIAKDIRTYHYGSVRRQYLVPAIRREFGPGVSQGLRALHDHERDTDPTHYRVIWFAEANAI